MILTSKASLQIQKPIEEVYDAIINPEVMTNFFISESNARMDSEKDIIWKFPEFEERFPISHIELSKNESVSFVWDPDTVVEIILTSYSTSSTVIHISEGGKEYNEQNLQWLISNTAGWANFLACMKAYMEYGVHLRKGAYEFMKGNG